MAAALLAAICATPSLDAIADARPRLTRHLREPPRRRGYLCDAPLS